MLALEGGAMTQRVERRTATTVGILYIVGTLAGIASVAAAGSLLGRPIDLPAIAADRDRLAIGAAFVLLMGISLALVPAVLFPIFRRFNEPLAVGAVIFRGALETVGYMLIAGIWLVLIELADRAATTGTLAANGAIGAQLLDAADVVNEVLLPVFFAIGSLMIFWVFFTSRLIPRWLAIWGLIGAVLYFVAPLLRLIDVSWGFLMAPLGVGEMVMAVWLIMRGFAVPRSRGVEAPSLAQPTNQPDAVAKVRS